MVSSAPSISKRSLPVACRQLHIADDAEAERWMGTTHRREKVAVRQPAFSR
jgi:hypothetical protein